MEHPGLWPSTDTLKCCFGKQCSFLFESFYEHYPYRSKICTVIEIYAGFFFWLFHLLGFACCALGRFYRTLTSREKTTVPVQGSKIMTPTPHNHTNLMDLNRFD